ncbi:MAG: MFS transporter [Gemmatimonadaceae bacterium]
MTPPHERWPAAVKLVMGARMARSVGQGALVVGFTLYLHALGWTAASIGMVLSAALLFGVSLTLLIGPASDRLGRKQFLLAYEVITIVAAVLALLSSRTWILTLGAVLGGFGRGANGAAGPFGPLEQAWLAQGLPASQRPRVFNLNSTLGFMGMAAGALLAALPGAWSGVQPGALAFRPLFVLPLLGSAVGFVLIWKAPDIAPPRPAAVPRATSARTSLPATDAASAPSAIRRQENRQLVGLALANTLNGFGIGLVAPLMAYWFLRRFGHGPATIGPALAAGFVLAAVGSQIAQRIVPRFGVVRTVVVMRGVGLVLMVLTPFVPVFGLAAAIWAVRAAFNQGTLGVRQALAMGLTRPHRQGLAATVNNVSIQVPRAIGPAIAGLMLHQGWLTAPFVVAAMFQLGYLVVYQRFFGALETAAAA